MKPLYASKHVQWCEREAKLSLDIFAPYFNLTLKKNSMRKIQITISDLEFNKFGLKKNNFAFSDFIEIVSQEFAKQTLSKSIELAERYGLSGLSMNKISKEVKAVRKHA